MISSYHHSDFRLEQLLERKSEPVAIVLPAREVAGTVGPIVESLLGLDGLVDQVLVVDAASRDGSAEVARAAGAEVVQESELVPQVGPVLGKGDAMWRALAAARGETIAYIDADTRDFDPHFATGMLGPLIVRDDVQFVKGTFRRPFIFDGVELPDDGGRVTELTARPLLSAFYPELAHFRQPLAGEIAARRELLESVPFPTGYAIETGMLIDIYTRVGLEAMVEVDLDERRNTHQPLYNLGPMAYAVLCAVVERLQREGRMHEAGLPAFRAVDGRLLDPQMVERPAFASMRASA